MIRTSSRGLARHLVVRSPSCTLAPKPLFKKRQPRPGQALLPRAILFLCCFASRMLPPPLDEVAAYPWPRTRTWQEHEQMAVIPAAPPPDTNQSHFSGAAAGRDADTHRFVQGTPQRTAGATPGMAAAAAVQHGSAATARHRRYLSSASQPVVSAPQAKQRCRQTLQRTSWGPCHFSAT